MWYLTGSNDGRTIYVLPNKEISIGRSTDAQVCSFAITDDASISRKHAILSVSNNNLYVQDLGSRYGTFINDCTDNVESNAQVQLKKGDVVKFGKLGSVWQVHQTSFVICTSTLKGENLQNLRQCLGELGAVLKNEWDDTCSHLTMPAITLTIKVVLALAQGSHIVTPEYWTKCLEATNSHTKIPDPNSFTPKVIEPSLNKDNVTFLPDEKRQTLFAGKVFVFFSAKQLEMYKAVLLKCSADPQLWSVNLSNSKLSESNVVVIFNPSHMTQETQAQRDQINNIIDYLKSKGRRVVADAEIGLAILYCSINKYCNPDFNFTSEVIKQSSGQNTKVGNILAPETQPMSNQTQKENVVINESLQSVTTNFKRKFSDENIETEMNANKKLATGNIQSNNDSGKRKFSDDANGTSNPIKKVAVHNEDDIFNFKSNTVNSGKGKGPDKKLIFSKPGKRTADNMNEDDELFNFVPDKSSDVTKSNLFDANKANNIKQEKDAEEPPFKKCDLGDENIDVLALRGSKLKELADIKFDENVLKNVKKEDPDELDKKMNNLDLGAPILILRNDLIKKEPFSLPEVNDSHNGTLKNFKTFKKVWFVKRQQAPLIKPAMTVVIGDTQNTEEVNSMCY